MFHFLDGEVGEDVGVVYQNRLVGAVVEQRAGFKQATTCVEQFRLEGDVYVATEIVVVGKIVGYLVGEMVGVYHHARDAAVAQFLDYAPQHRFPSHRHKCLGMLEGERAQPGSEPGCEYHCLHYFGLKSCSMFCSRWKSSTFTLNCE